MTSSTDPHGKPALDAGKTPYGHPDEAPMGSTLPPDEESSHVDLLGDGVEHAHETLDAFAESELPVFPPVHVALAEANADAVLPPPPSHEEEVPARKLSPGDVFGEWIRAYPLTAVVAAGAIGALIVRLSR